MNTKNLFAVAMIAGLVAGSVAKAEDKAAAPEMKKEANSCKGGNGCHKGKKDGEHKGHGKKKHDDKATAPAAGAAETAPATGTGH